MKESKPALPPGWDDPEGPELTEEIMAIAEIRVGGKVIRPATGYLAPDGIRLGRPPARDRAKQQVTLRIDPDVLEKFRADGPGWQGRMNDALRTAAGLA